MGMLEKMESVCKQVNKALEQLYEFGDDVFLPVYAMLLEEYMKNKGRSEEVPQMFEQLSIWSKGVADELGAY